MTIQWFPGHMAKANRQLKEILNKVDVVIELVDARIPLSSRNPMLDETVQNKPRLIALTKRDMADEDVTKQWIEHFESGGERVVSVDARSGQGVKELLAASKELAEPALKKWKDKGITPRAARAMVAGVPNVGKSTLINRLLNKKTAKIGDTPGITKHQQWLKVGKEIELLDTPGILWPKFEHDDVGYRLAATGAIKDERLDFEDVALYVVNTLKERYPHALKERYKVSDEALEDGVQCFEAIGRHRGCLVGGGHVDFDKAAEFILRDFRKEKLGRISLEHPNDWM
ncbi:ribosome biogenesis GTPase YlqF [Salsuginibacillus kocurii]|uniref:ribosome biogenesis GTPase YlqF n=1 Tax=Salsuginibacillus kocurii TaxID=427078 RepID=UPI00036F1AB0|nr:ribosome biogenesis GTPase YlqF [Salsuginibacillus kocurii]